MTASSNKPLPPNSTIGIIGGGQLGRMLASAAARLGFKSIVLEPGHEPPAAQVCNRHIEAAYDDPAALDELVAACDVVTYEFENVPMAAARIVEDAKPLYPPAGALEVSQDRLMEKRSLREAGIAVADFIAVDEFDGLKSALLEFGGGVLKTRRFGYDGKGQKVFQSADLPDDFDLGGLGQGPFILERLIDFDSEFSVIAARAVDGTIAAYEPSMNVHEDGILRTSTVPSGLALGVVEEARSVSAQLLEALDYVGVVGVEFFCTGEEILVNEFAPRVHNSGHWTREACVTGQFEQHIRAITGHKLGSVARHSDCEMINLIGSQADDVARYLDDPHALLTLYGKAESRAGRKMGHVTRLR
ncbi:5-(carboxyamino)imidazole ribonucleotide synthase [Pseudahrensia aquimaris]|uniref:N5-carboxyaminoimidazole ribonucleotide synthase n=1 Tax=Pseudahrensia aquimaris TaxID=744461 RepID=A0ABW3FCH0_9HYPH